MSKLSAQNLWMDGINPTHKGYGLMLTMVILMYSIMAIVMSTVMVMKIILMIGPMGAHACPSWWRNQMETCSALLILCAGFPAQRPVTRSFDVFIDLCLNKWLNEQSPGW